MRIRIQGASVCELWRQREIYHVISYFAKNKDVEIILKNDRTKDVIKKWVKSIIEYYSNWDVYYVDIAYTLFLHYLESIRSDERTHTYGELVDFIKEMAGNDDGGQVYKIYDQYLSERILKDTPLTIVLTTMHKVKGLEFDIVVVTPSFANLPLKPHRSYQPGEPLKEDDIADINEEKRLRFVAYTRAKKRLYIFNGVREMALKNCQIYEAPEDLQSKLGVTERAPGLDKYNLGYHSNAESNFNNQGVFSSIQTNAVIEIRKVQKSWGSSYEIIHLQSGQVLGQLSASSNIGAAMMKNGDERLSGFFISDIFAWEYDDSVKADLRNNTNYAAKWCPQARSQGYVYVVQIAGYGK